MYCLGCVSCRNCRWINCFNQFMEDTSWKIQTAFGACNTDWVKREADYKLDNATWIVNLWLIHIWVYWHNWIQITLILSEFKLEWRKWIQVTMSKPYLQTALSSTPPSIRPFRRPLYGCPPLSVLSLGPVPSIRLSQTGNRCILVVSWLSSTKHQTANDQWGGRPNQAPPLCAQ